MDWWIEYLKKKARIKDKKIFNDWEIREININECIYQFKINNDIPLDFIVDYERFEKWLNSLGWERGYNE